MAHFLTVERQQYRNVTFQSDYMLGGVLKFELWPWSMLYGTLICCLG